MKVVAHPLIVAVALGLIGPSSLETIEEADEPNNCRYCDDCTTPSHMTLDEAPEPEEMQRVQLEWEEARTWI